MLLVSEAKVPSIIPYTKRSQQKHLGQYRVDIHSTYTPSTGYLSDVGTSISVCWMKGIHSWCRIKIDWISFRPKISGFGAKNDEKSSISQKLMYGFSWKIVYMLSEYEMRLLPKYGVNRPSGLGGVCWQTDKQTDRQTYRGPTSIRV